MIPVRLIAAMCCALLFIAAANAEFLCGVSGSSGGLDISKLLVDDMHVTHERRYLMWKYAQPAIKKSEFDFNLTVAAVKADPVKYVDAWAASVPRWSALDNMIATLCQDLAPVAGRIIRPVLEVFEGTVSGLPHFVDDSVAADEQFTNESTNTAATIAFVEPCVVGREAYLAHAYRWVRAVTRRYVPVIQRHCMRAASGTSSIIFQIENELNEAGLATIYGQRSFCPMFFNFSFLTETLSVLRQAVKDDAPFVDVTQNLHTDVPESFHRALNLPGFFTDAARAWDSLIDIWSIDAYPNMLVAWPVQGFVVGNRIRNLTAAIANVSKRVFVMETGYPALNPAAQPQPPTGARVLNFSEANQAAYASQAVMSVAAAGGVGLFFFQATQSAGMMPPPGGYRAADVAMFREARDFLQQQNVTQLVDWLLQPGNLDEVIQRAPLFALRADNQNGWAIFDEQRRPKPVFHALAAEFKKLCP